jgi:hypothetical protein
LVNQALELVDEVIGLLREVAVHPGHARLTSLWQISQERASRWAKMRLWW